MRVLSLDILDAELPGNYNYDDLWAGCQRDCRLQIDTSQIHCWNVEDMLLSLKSGFKVAYLKQITEVSNLGTEDSKKAELDLIKLISDVRHRSNSFEKHQYIDDLFEVRSPSCSTELNV